MPMINAVPNEVADVLLDASFTLMQVWIEQGVDE